jgi:hypothetical protein
MAFASYRSKDPIPAVANKTYRFGLDIELGELYPTPPKILPRWSMMMSRLQMF